MRRTLGVPIVGWIGRILERERNFNQHAYINQLRLNRDLPEKASRQLKEKLDKRTREVMGNMGCPAISERG